MKLQRVTFSVIVALIALLAYSATISAFAQSSDGLTPFVGRWQINSSKSTFNRYGPNGKNQPGGPKRTLIFTAQGSGLKFDVYSAYPQAAPNRSMSVVLDGKPHLCAGDCLAVGGTDPEREGQTYTYTKIDSHMIVRVTYAKQKVNEYLAYSISTDGKTLTQINWSAETPEWQNIYVFEKQP